MSVMFNGNMIIQKFRKRFYLYLSHFLSQKQYWNTVGKLFPLDAILDNCSNTNLFFKTGREIVDFFESERLTGKKAKTLHVGCGIGRIEKYLALRVGSCYGVDISEVMVNQAKKNVNYPNTSFVATDGEHLPYPNNYFNFVYSVLVFQHMPIKLFRANLKEVQRVLKPKAKFLFQIPIDEKGIMKNPGVTNPWLMRYYKRSEIKKMLERAGFKIIKSYGVDDNNPDHNFIPDFKVLAVKT